MHRTVAIVRFIGHVAANRRVVAEYNVLHQRLPRTNRFKEFPHVRAEIVVVVSFITDGLGSRLLSWLGVVLRVPLLEVCILQMRRQAIAVIAGSQVDAGLRNVS